MSTIFGANCKPKYSFAPTIEYSSSTTTGAKKLRQFARRFGFENKSTHVEF